MDIKPKAEDSKPITPTVAELQDQLARMTTERDNALYNLQVANHLLGIIRHTVGPGNR